MCARHIWANWQKKWRGEERRKAFWRCAKASFEVKLKDEFTYLGMLGDRICESLLVYNKEFWCRALFSETSKCDVVENNMCETFNAWIVGSRHKSVISMLEDIRHKIMNRHGDMIKFASTWTSDISPMARQVLEENKEIGRKLRVIWNHDIGFEIEEGEYRHVVDMVKQTCTCRLWQWRGIPCQHVVCALYHMGKEPEDYVDHWYRKDTSLKAYNYYLQPMTNMVMWPETNNLPIEPPEAKPMPGRPAKCRRKDKDEPTNKKWGKASKNGVKMTCSKCHQVGHNKRGCKVSTPHPSQATGQSSQSTPHQSTTQNSTAQPSRSTSQQPSTQHSTSLCLETSKVTGNKRKQPTGATNSTGTKKSATMGFGVYTDTQSGRQVIDPGRVSERVISSGSLKDASQRNVDLGFKPPGLKWKGKNAMTANQLQLMSQQKKMQIKFNWVP